MSCVMNGSPTCLTPSRFLPHLSSRGQCCGDSPPTHTAGIQDVQSQDQGGSPNTLHTLLNTSISMAPVRNRNRGRGRGFLQMRACSGSSWQGVLFRSFALTCCGIHVYFTVKIIGSNNTEMCYTGSAALLLREKAKHTGHLVEVAPSDTAPSDSAPSDTAPP